MRDRLSRTGWKLGKPTRQLAAPGISTGGIAEIHRIDRELSRPASHAGRTHLVIPDSHAHPDFPNDRFDWLGRFLLDLKPDVVVDIGDMADIPSLSIYDGARSVGGAGGKKSFEGRRYKLDVAAAIDARRRILLPFDTENSRLIAAGEKPLILPELHSCEGNHEDRIRRVSSLIPELDGVISIDDLEIEKLGWKFHEFRIPAIIDGIAYAHFLISGVMGKPVGGVNHARSLILKGLTSSTVGHSHLRDFAETVTADNRRLLGLIVGCFFDFHADFAGPANSLYWRGLVVKRCVQAGNYDHQWISLDYLRATYGH